MSYIVPEPTLESIRIFGPNTLYSGNTNAYICMGYFSDDSGMQVFPLWSLSNFVAGVTITEDGCLTAANVVQTKVVGVQAVVESESGCITNWLDVSVLPPYLTLGNTTASMAKTEGQSSVTVRCSGSWTAEITTGADWLSLVNESGFGDGIIAFAATKNTDTKSRKGVITVRCGSVTASINIKQAAGDAVVYVTVTFDAQGGNANYTEHQYIVGEKYGTLPRPTRSGWKFGGWWTGANGAGSRVIASDTVVDSITHLLAYWMEMDVGGVLNDTLEWMEDAANPWTIDNSTGIDGTAMRTAPISDGGESMLAVNVEGPGTLMFYWKASSEELWDVLAMFDNDDYVREISGETDWEFVEYKIPDAGEHIIKWVYSKDDADGSGYDCAWIDSVIWMPDVKPGEIAKQDASGHAVPQAWLDQHSLTGTGNSLDFDSDGDGVTDWEEYVSGSDPNNPESKLIVSIEMNGSGKPMFRHMPNLGSLRTYVYEGKTNLTDAAWVTPTNSAHRFFRVKVNMK